MPSPVEARADGVYVRVRVQPRASRNALVIESDGRIRVALTAPPLEGKANRALTEFIAEVLDISRSRVRIASGDKGREKALVVAGLTAPEVETRLTQAAKTP